MKKSEKIIIKFSGLPQGEHFFEFEIDNTFFNQIEGSLIQKGELAVYVQFVKMSTILHLHLKFTGKVEIACDRCLDEVYIPISGQDELVVKFGDDIEEETPNLISVPINETELDITLFVYEMIALNLPFRKIPCEILSDTDVCDNEMLKKLEELEVKVLPDDKKENNPLWDSLNKLKNLN